jgi:hypothetical protein
MKPAVIIGVVLIVLGAAVVALQGVSYVRDRQEVSIGPVGITTEERGFVPPLAGAVAIIAGVAFLFVGRRRTAA